MTNLRWDAFICHASEDKDAIARPLANHLANHRLRVWIDEGEIVAGESIREKIDEGLAHSRFGVVVLSRSFLEKTWTRSELGGLFARETAGVRVLIPVWHELTAKEVLALSPLLAERLALNTEVGLAAVASAIAKQVRQETGSYRPGMPIFAGCLTKKQLMALPEGAYLLSNIMNSDLTPIVSQPLPEMSEREDFWMQLKMKGISASRFYVFADAVEFRAHMSARQIFL